MVESSSLVVASSIPVLQPLMQEIFGLAIMGGRLRTLRRPYDGVVDFCRKKLATAIQRRIGEANNLDNLSELGEDLEAGSGRQDGGSTVVPECASPFAQLSGSKTTTTVVEGK